MRVVSGTTDLQVLIKAQKFTVSAVYSLDDKGQLWVENKTANGSRKSVYKKTT